MTTREFNFDGLIGPTHNYAGLSLGNVASAGNAGGESRPRAAALQGLAKMRLLMDRGLGQGFFPPPRRPAAASLKRLGFTGDNRAVLTRAAEEDPALFRNACSASAMWAANAATVIAAPDSGDGRVHFVTANLATMLHRSLEAEETFARLLTIFADPGRFAVHGPLAPGRHLSDEGAANHMRIAEHHGARGLNVIVHGGEMRGAFPARQARRAGEAVARLAGVGDMLHVQQAEEAIQAGAFHNDVVAVANETVLLAHPQAFAEREALLARAAAVPGFTPVWVEGVTLAEAVASYLFNSQLVTMPEGHMALVLPAETGEVASVAAAVARLTGGNGPVREAITVDVRESMRNGGGPACLRLRVPLDETAEAAVTPGYLLDAQRWEELARLVERWWPERITAGDLADPALWDAAAAADEALAQWLSGEARRSPTR